MKRVVIVALAVLAGLVLCGVLGAARYRSDGRWMEHDPAVKKLIDLHKQREESPDDLGHAGAEQPP